MQFNVLCAMRDRQLARRLCMELEDGSRCNFRVVTDGRAAVESCRSFAPDILVVDAVLPQIDGLGVMDSVRSMLGDRMPRVIGGSMLHFADEAMQQRGADMIVGVPWKKEELRAALLLQMERIQTHVDWASVQAAYRRARTLLEGMGMNGALKGCGYLAWAAALAYENEDRLNAVGENIYLPIARRFGTTKTCVERLIRHAVERTMDTARTENVYRFFGNTIDPMRGKPTNAQYISALAQRLRIQ